MIKQVYQLLFVSLLIVSAVCASIPQASEIPVCPAPGDLSLGLTAAETIDEMTYHEINKFNLTEGGSADIFITYGQPTAGLNFQFQIFQDDYKTKVKRECPGTSTFTFIRSINDFIVLYDGSKSQYKLCLFDLEGNEAKMVTLNIPSSITTVQTFYPFYYMGKERVLYVAISGSGKGNIVGYNVYYPNTITDPSISVTPRVYGQELTIKMTNLHGVALLFLDKETGSFWRYSMINYQWSIDSTTFPVALGQQVDILPIKNYYFAVTVLTPQKTSGKVYIADFYTIHASSKVHAQISLANADREYVIENDNIRNIVIHGENYFYWFNFDHLENRKSFELTNNEIDTTDLISMALSGDKAILLFDDRADYYRITGTGLKTAVNPTTKIELLFSRTYDSADIENDGQYRFGLSCLCGKVLKRFSCFSSTLNCLLLKKAGSECGKKDIPVTN